MPSGFCREERPAADEGRAACGGGPFSGKHLITRHNQERTTLPGLTQKPGQVSAELAHADPLRRLVWTEFGRTPHLNTFCVTIHRVTVSDQAGLTCATMLLGHHVYRRLVKTV